MLWISALRSAIGMTATILLVGNGALPLLLPGVAAIVYFIKGSFEPKSRDSRVGLCLSSSMWVGSAAALVCHETTQHSIFFAAVITSFAVTDIMLASMRLESVS
jgi:hypothetical protein